MADVTRRDHRGVDQEAPAIIEKPERPSFAFVAAEPLVQARDGAHRQCFAQSLLDPRAIELCIVAAVNALQPELWNRTHDLAFA
jgi:hypothetical protein